MGSRQQEFSGTRGVLDAHRFDVQRLTEFMQSHVNGFAGPLTVSQFKGGQSNPTYLLQSESGKYVLRRKPPGRLLQSAHAVEREYRVISSLHAAGFPVPEPILLCEDETVVGTTFFVMEYVEGRIFWELSLPDCDPDERGAIYDSLNATIAKMHSLSVAKLGLSDFGKPGNYFARQISRWSSQFTASKTCDVPSMSRLIEWLPDNIPADSSIAVVHGDFRLDNVVIHPTRPEVLAILDWELSTIGDPLGDFTYHLMAWQFPDIGIGSSGLKDVDIDALGIPSEQEYVARYCERTRRDEGIRNRDFYSAYNFFRIAAISQGIAGRVREGTAASVHAEQAEFAVTPLADLGWAYANRTI